MLKPIVLDDLELHTRSVIDGRSLIVVLLIGAIAAGILYTKICAEKAYSAFPEVPIERKGYEHFLPSYIFWIKDGQSLLSKGLRQFTGCFQVPTASGYKIIVPNHFADELRNHPDLNFNEAFAKDFFVNYPGFDGHLAGLQDDNFIQEVVRVKLTQSLNLVTDDLVEETTDSLNDVLGNDCEWNTRFLKQDLLHVVARLSSRVFLGKELCRNEEWLEITKNYTVDSFLAANLLKLCPGVIRPLAYWFIPTCTRLRKEVRDARRLILPEVEERRKRAEALIAAGEKAPKAADAIGWMVEVSRGRFIDYVGGQLGLSMAAIHTTSETTINCLLELCDNPEIVSMLREEMIEVLSKNGWSKVSLYKMKLLDSFLKEVQRKRGLSSTSMNRLVKKDVTLSDGAVLPAGARIMISDDKVHDPISFPEPSKFDAARFQRLRERPGEENRHQFVTTTPDHMGFGHGQHACPGRFFASNEMKVLLCFLLIKYDMRHIPGRAEPKYMDFETAKFSDPSTQIEIRRRAEEIDLQNPLAKPLQEA